MRTKFFPCPVVNKCSSLPKPGRMKSRMYIVLQTTDVDHMAGFWHSDGSTWKRLGDAPALGGFSNPPSGMCAVTNLFVDPETGKLEVEYNDIPEP